MASLLQHSSTRGPTHQSKRTTTRPAAPHTAAHLKGSIKGPFVIPSRRNIICEPTTLAYIGLAVSAVGAGAAYEQQRGTASRQTDAINKNNDLQQNDLQRQAEQTRAASAAELNAHSQQAAKDAALFDVITGEYGGGKTASRTAAVGDVQTGEALSTISTNASNRLGELGFQGIGAGARSASQLASLSHPSLFGTALQIGSAGIKAQDQINEGNRLAALAGKR